MFTIITAGHAIRSTQLRKWTCDINILVTSTSDEFGLAQLVSCYLSCAGEPYKAGLGPCNWTGVMKNANRRPVLQSGLMSGRIRQGFSPLRLGSVYDGFERWSSSLTSIKMSVEYRLRGKSWARTRLPPATDQSLGQVTPRENMIQV